MYEINDLDQLEAALARVRNLPRLRSTARSGLVGGAVRRLLVAGYPHAALDALLARHSVKQPGSLSRWLKRGEKHGRGEHALEEAARLAQEGSPVLAAPFAPSISRGGGVVSGTALAAPGDCDGHGKAAQEGELGSAKGGTGRSGEAPAGTGRDGPTPVGAKSDHEVVGAEKSDQSPADILQQRYFARRTKEIKNTKGEQTPKEYLNPEEYPKDPEARLKIAEQLLGPRRGRPLL